MLYSVIPAREALHVPDGIMMIEAAVIPETYVTVWANRLEVGQVHPGDFVLIPGRTCGVSTVALLRGASGIAALATAGSKATGLPRSTELRSTIGKSTL